MALPGRDGGDRRRPLGGVSPVNPFSKGSCHGRYLASAADDQRRRRARHRPLRLRSDRRAHPGADESGPAPGPGLRHACERPGQSLRLRAGPRHRARRRSAIHQERRARGGAPAPAPGRRAVHRVHPRAQLGQGARHSHARLRPGVDAYLPAGDAEGRATARRILGPPGCRRTSGGGGRRHDTDDAGHHRARRIRLRLRLLRPRRAAPVRQLDGELPGVGDDQCRPHPGADHSERDAAMRADAAYLARVVDEVIAAAPPRRPLPPAGRRTCWG